MEMRKLIWALIVFFFVGCTDKADVKGQVISDVLLLKLMFGLVILLTILRNRHLIKNTVAKKMQEFLNTDPNSNKKTAKPESSKMMQQTDAYKESSQIQTEQNTQHMDQELIRRIYNAEKEIERLIYEIERLKNVNSSASVHQRSHLDEAIRNEIAAQVSQQLKETYKSNRDSIVKYVSSSATPAIISDLEQKIAALVKSEIGKLQRTGQAVPYQSPNPQKTQSRPTEDVQKATVASAGSMFASAPQGNLFHKFSTDFRPFDTLFVIHPTPYSPGMGTFTLVDHEPTLDYAFSMIDSLRDACDLLGSNEPSAKTMQAKPGTVEKRGDQWLIRDKIQLDW
jgi:hypothetical protein